MDIKEWLQKATKKLSRAGISSPRLDAELLLAHFFQKPREYLFAHPELTVDNIQRHKGQSLAVLDTLLEQRVKREPVAYILGYKEFYGRDFVVTPDVLIPRPESEMMIDLLKQIVKGGKWLLEYSEIQIIDIGTGSGCLAISAKLEIPKAKVIATDISQKALKIARQNAKKHSANIEFSRGSLLDPLPYSIFSIPCSIVMANLPYVDKSWQVSPETHYEPSGALYADDQGFALIKKLIIQATQKLSGGGLLLLEADPRQHTLIVDYAAKNGFRLQQTQDFIIDLEKT